MPRFPPFPSADYVLERLEILWRKLEEEGSYVRANTVALAIEEIKRLQPPLDETIFGEDK